MIQSVLAAVLVVAAGLRVRGSVIRGWGLVYLSRKCTDKEKGNEPQLKLLTHTHTHTPRLWLLY
jgi:hypothetical protein